MWNPGGDCRGYVGLFPTLQEGACVFTTVTQLGLRSRSSPSAVSSLCECYVMFIRLSRLESSDGRQTDSSLEVSSIIKRDKGIELGKSFTQDRSSERASGLLCWVRPVREHRGFSPRMHRAGLRSGVWGAGAASLLDASLQE